MEQNSFSAAQQTVWGHQRHRVGKISKGNSKQWVATLFIQSACGLLMLHTISGLAILDVFSHVQPDLKGTLLQLAREAFNSQKQAINLSQCHCPLMCRKRITLKQRSFAVTTQSEKKQPSCWPVGRVQADFFHLSKDKIREKLAIQRGQAAS